MKNLRITLFIVSVFAFAVISCQKGDTGPAGARGAAGPDSVLHSSWITLNTPATDAGDTIFSEKLAAPAITQSIIDSGLILSYFETTSGTIFAVSSAGYNVSEDFSVDSITITSYYIDLTGVLYRYVIVPGTVDLGTMVSGPAKGITTSELKKMSYADVQKLLGAKTLSSN